MIPHREKQVVGHKEGIVLDIDNTLAATSRFFFCSLAERFGLPEGESIESLYERYHYSWRVPLWQSKEARDWDQAQELSPSFHEGIDVIAEARMGVLLLEGIVPVRAYVTSRPEILRNVTHAWLNRNGFPDAPLVMRPNAVSSKSGNQWKVHQVYSFFANTFGIVDDHPDIARGLAALNYPGHVFLYNVHPLVSVGANVVPCTNWQDIIEAVRAREGRPTTLSML